MSITTGARLVLALLLVVLAIAAIVYVGRATDTLRDEPDSAIPPWWKTARKLRARMAQLSDDTARNQDLKEKYPDFDGTDVSRYDDLASKALAGEPVEAADVNATCFGLALRKPDWKPVRASFLTTQLNDRLVELLRIVLRINGSRS